MLGGNIGTSCRGSGMFELGAVQNVLVGSEYQIFCRDF